jgi:hypothetical protein
MQEPPPDDPAMLLGDAPIGTYLLELRGLTLIVWRLSEGEPEAAAFDPASLMSARSRNLRLMAARNHVQESRTQST